MPELPEVEVIRMGLEKKIVGLTIKNIEVLNAKTYGGDPRLAESGKVTKVWRRAKVLGIDLVRQSLIVNRKSKNKDDTRPTTDGTLTLLFHLKMTGQLVLSNESGVTSKTNSQPKTHHSPLIGGHPTLDMLGEMPNRSTRVIFSFNDGSQLFFNDQRKFGWIKLVSSDLVTSDKFLQSLGPEPLEKEFTWQVLKERLLHHPSLPVKVSLMDQTAVAGIGNIYASEGCFNAKLDPRKKVKELSDANYQALTKGIKDALLASIKYGGSSRAHYVNSDGEKGYFLEFAHVYNRAGDLCTVCGSVIKKATQAGRSTFFCEKCQQP